MTGTDSENRRLGYARVSTCGQTLDAQLEQLRRAGCTKIYRAKCVPLEPRSTRRCAPPRAYNPLGLAVTPSSVIGLPPSTLFL